MNPFASSVFRRSIVVTGLIAAVVCAQAQTVDDNPLLKKEVLEQVTSILSKNAFVPGVDFGKWPEFIKAEQAQIDAANNDDDFQKAVNAALKKFGASHTVLNAPKVADLRLTGSMVGVGVSTRPDPAGLLVTRTIFDAPAERGGIVAGDIIVKIDGKPAFSTAGMEGSEGINTFGFAYDRKRVLDIMSEAKESKKLILDLRDNGGGEIGNLRHLLGFFTTSDQPVGTFIDRTIVNEYSAATHGNPTDLAAIAKWTKKKVRPIPEPDTLRYSGKVVVLINGLSGSASEILAQGFRDVLGSKIVGTKSAGAVLVSLYVDASNGFMLQFPLSDYVTINGTRLEGKGVTPDFVVSDPTIHTAKGPDPARDKAIALLNAGW